MEELKQFIENYSFPTLNMVLLIISCLLMVLIPIVFLVIWKKKYGKQASWLYLFIGAVGFLVSVRVLELGVHMFCIVLDNPVSRFITGSNLAYAIYGACMAGVFEEVGRYIILKYLLKKNHTPVNAVMYGIGHGGIEVLAVILPLYISYLAIGLILSHVDAESAMQTLKITEENAAIVLPQLQSMTAMSAMDIMLGVVERVLTMFVHIGLTLIVYYGVEKSKVGCLFLAILLHAVLDFPAALYQRGAVPLWLVEIWLVICVAAIMAIAVPMYRACGNKDFGE